MANRAQDLECRKVALWYIPHCLHTAIARSLTTTPNTHGLFEYFSTAATMGPEAIYRPPYIQNNLINPKFTYELVKSYVESSHNGRNFVLITDPAYAIDPTKYDKLPRGFQHTFIIRHPAKVFAAWERMVRSTRHGELQLHMPKGDCFKESRDLHRHVTEVLKQPSIVVDADDLIAQPALIIQLYCNTLGLPFTESMLSWDVLDNIPMNWHIPDEFFKERNIFGWQKNLFESTGLRAGVPQTVNWDDLSPEVCHYAAKNMPYYNELYKVRIRPNQREPMNFVDYNQNSFI